MTTTKRSATGLVPESRAMAPSVDALSVAEWRKRADSVPDSGTPAAVAFWAALHAIADHADHATGANAFPDYPRLALRVKRSGRKIQDDVTLAEAVGLLVAKRRRNKPKLYQMAWPADRVPAEIADDIARLRVDVAKRRAKGKKVWNGPPPSDQGTDPRGPLLERTPGGRSGTDPRGHSGTDPGGPPTSLLPPSTKKAAAEPLLLHASGEEEDGSGHDCPEPSRLTDDELARAVGHRVSEMRAAGTVTNEGGLRRRLTATFRDDPANGREVLARAARAAGPPVLTARASAYRARLLELADEAMSLGEHGTAEALRLVARRIRETGELPDETPEEVAEREREHRRALMAEEQVA